MVFNLQTLKVILSHGCSASPRQAHLLPRVTLVVYINPHLHMLPVELQDLAFKLFLVWQILVCFKVFSIFRFIKIPYFSYDRKQNNGRVRRNDGKGTMTENTWYRIKEATRAFKQFKFVMMLCSQFNFIKLTFIPSFLGITTVFEHCLENLGCKM